MKKMIMLAAIVCGMMIVPARAEDARALYTQQCAKCHGEDGKGQTKMGKKLGAKDYSDAKVQDALKDEAAVKAIKEGLKDGDRTLMKSAEGLTDDQIKGLVACIRSFKK